MDQICQEHSEAQLANLTRHTSQSGSTTLGPSLKNVSSGIVHKLNVEDEDVEKGGKELHHVSLAIQGMTCSGCATKLASAISDSFPAVSSIRVNFVMGTAEFDVDTSQVLASDIVRAVHKTTSFNCTVITTVSHYLDIVAVSSCAARVIQNLGILGVLEISVLDKRVLRIGYDPKVVGARTLLQEIGGLTHGLAPPSEDISQSTGRKRLFDKMVKTAVAVILTIPILVLAWAPLKMNKTVGIGIQCTLATLVQLIPIPQFYRPALSALWYSGIVEMDMLVVISITAAYLYSVVAFGFRLKGKPLAQAPEVFETSALLITLVVFSRLVVAYARIRAVAAVSIRGLQPVKAVVVDKNSEYEIDARLLQFGDTFKVTPHCKIVTDGSVVQGSSEVDESIITGESMPVAKYAGMDVIAGTTNGSGTLLVQPTRLPGQNTVTEIAAMVEQAARSTPKIQSLADRVASRFVPIVSAIGLMVFIVWMVVCYRVKREPKGDALAHAVTYAIAVLAVSCPCGIGLAVPMVLVIAGDIAARRGVVIKSGDSTEQARNVTDVLFDKTGTLTETELDVVSAEFVSDRDEAVRITEMLVSASKHPVSLAVARYLGVEQSPVDESVRDRPGSGIEGVDKDGITVWGGNSQFAGCSTHPTVKQLVQNKTTVFCVTKGNVLMVVFGLRTRLRPEATIVVTQLLHLGIGVHLVSGDHDEAVRGVAVACGIPLVNVIANCTPAMKRDYVEALQTFQSGRTVLFCGDGTNDAVAITQADIGVQISHGGELAREGSEIARGAADVVGLGGIPFLISLSKVAYQRIVFNFVWSAVYNVLAVLMAAGAFVRFRVEPAWAGLGELVSILAVIFAAVTMLAVKIQG